MGLVICQKHTIRFRKEPRCEFGVLSLSITEEVMFSAKDIIAGVLATVMLLGPLAMAPAYVAPEESRGNASTSTGDSTGIPTKPTE